MSLDRDRTLLAPPWTESRAWVVEIDDMPCVVFAATAAKAKFIGVRSYWEAYGPGGWPGVTVRRAERYDDNPLRFEPSRAWAEDYVRSCQASGDVGDGAC